jgi:hypothetical protein
MAYLTTLPVGEVIRRQLAIMWPEAGVTQSEVRTQYKILALKRTTTKLSVTGLRAELSL